MVNAVIVVLATVIAYNINVFDFLHCARNFVKYEGSKDILAVEALQGYASAIIGAREKRFLHFDLFVILVKIILQGFSMDFDSPKN